MKLTTKIIPCALSLLLCSCETQAIYDAVFSPYSDYDAPATGKVGDTMYDPIAKKPFKITKIFHTSDSYWKESHRRERLTPEGRAKIARREQEQIEFDAKNRAEAIAAGTYVPDQNTEIVNSLGQALSFGAALSSARSPGQNSTAGALQQIATAYTQSSGSSNSQYNSGTANEGRKMSGVKHLGAAWMGVVNVVCDIKGDDPLHNEASTQVSAAPSFVKKRGLSIRIYFTVTGYGSDGTLKTESWEEDVLVNGPYQHYGFGHTCNGGLKSVRITNVAVGGSMLSAP